MTQTLSQIRVLTFCILFCSFLAGGFYYASAQSQALNGQIEGVVTDSTGGAVPNATIVARNVETGTERLAAS
jgi:hypothetical protein